MHLEYDLFVSRVLQDFINLKLDWNEKWHFYVEFVFQNILNKISWCYYEVTIFKIFPLDLTELQIFNQDDSFLSRGQNEFLKNRAIYISPANASPFHSAFNKVIPFI